MDVLRNCTRAPARSSGHARQERKAACPRHINIGAHEHRGTLTSGHMNKRRPPDLELVVHELPIDHHPRGVLVVGRGLERVRRGGGGRGGGGKAECFAAGQSWELGLGGEG